MKTNFQYLFEEDGNWKLVKRLRETSDQTLFENRMAFEMPNGFVSERYKWNRIDKNEKLNKYILTYFGYKLFSQFQHYSALSMKLLREGQEYLFYYLVISIDGLCIITDLQIQLITGDNKHELLPKLKEIVGDIDKVFGKTEGKPTD